MAVDPLRRPSTAPGTSLAPKPMGGRGRRWRTRTTVIGIALAALVGVLALQWQQPRGRQGAPVDAPAHNTFLVGDTRDGLGDRPLLLAQAGNPPAGAGGMPPRAPAGAVPQGTAGMAAPPSGPVPQPAPGMPASPAAPAAPIAPGAWPMAPVPAGSPLGTPPLSGAASTPRAPAN